MSYLVLARRYRPQRFDEVVGQDHVVKTLSNAIKKGRLSHAYLFAGPRGTGKTSVARILAKSLNCEEGSSPHPCGKCSSCLEITKGESVDVIEIDGASNRGIDEIRDLREKVRFIPIRSRYKFYIIDEVHMLTEPAFNALLKILEEPPEHIIFLFATTEPYRIPYTVISRTQRFDFRRIPSSIITESLVRLTMHEGIKAERQALSYIASLSEGSLRDAQGILDQVIAYSGGEIRLEDVFAVLGMVKGEELISFTRAIGKGNLEETFGIIKRLIERGIDLCQFIFDLLRLFKDLLIITSLGDSAKTLVDFRVEFEDLRELAMDFKTGSLVGIIDELIRLTHEIRYSPHPRLQLELFLIRLATKQESQLIKIKTTPRLSLREIASIWPRLIKELRDKRPAIASCLEAGELIDLQDDYILLGFRKDSTFQRDVCEERETQSVIKCKLKEVFSQDLGIKTTLIEDTGKPVAIYQERGMNLDLLEAEPIVKRAVEIFGGKII